MSAKLTQIATFVTASMFDAVSSTNFSAWMSASMEDLLQQRKTICAIASCAS